MKRVLHALPATLNDLGTNERTLQVTKTILGVQWVVWEEGLVVKGRVHATTNCFCNSSRRFPSSKLAQPGYARN
eukprot:1158085-Pelagomonas_calceolata.AAC.4